MHAPVVGFCCCLQSGAFIVVCFAAVPVLLLLVSPPPCFRGAPAGDRVTSKLTRRLAQDMEPQTNLNRASGEVTHVRLKALFLQPARADGGPDVRGF